ncbi:hypothetical protein AB3N61_09330 [Leptospira sp. WS58.C1]|uniref:hypothetical protein n=1 Tax=Leptospira cinconiae TaxID=3235173 RepID=UPI00349EFAA9
MESRTTRLYAPAQIILPEAVYLDEKLNATQLRIFGIIHIFTSSRGYCELYNPQIAMWIKKDQTTVGKGIGVLEKRNHLKLKFMPHDIDGTKRLIFNPYISGQKENLGSPEKRSGSLHARGGVAGEARKEGSLHARGGVAGEARKEQEDRYTIKSKNEKASWKRFVEYAENKLSKSSAEQIRNAMGVDELPDNLKLVWQRWYEKVSA